MIQPQRALLMRGCQYSSEGKVQNVFLINDLYHVYYKKVYHKSEWMEDPLGTNIIRYIILYEVDLGYTAGCFLNQHLSTHNNSTIDI